LGRVHAWGFLGSTHFANLQVKKYLQKRVGKATYPLAYLGSSSIVGLGTDASGDNASMVTKKRKTAQRKSPIEVIIAEKNPLLQSGLIRLFVADERFVLVSMAPDGERFLTAAENVRFDVGVIGWEMPYLSGRGVLEAFLQKDVNSKLIVYTGSSAPNIPAEAEMLGAWGFCSKSEPGSSLLETIAAVADGRKVFPFATNSRAVDDPLSSLTPRERELLTALASGITNAQIAKRFDISLNTVKFHLKNLYEKLNVDNRSQAVAFYLSSRKIV